MRYLTGIFALSILAFAQTSETKREAFTITIKVSGTMFNSGEPIPVHLALQNTSGSDIVVTRHRGHRKETRDYRIEIRDSDGQLVPPTPLPLDMIIIGGTSGQTIKNKETAKDVIDITKHFDIKRPGSYTIQFGKSDPVSGRIVQSNKIFITISG